MLTTCVHLAARQLLTRHGRLVNGRAFVHLFHPILKVVVVLLLTNLLVAEGFTVDLLLDGKGVFEVCLALLHFVYPAVVVVMVVQIMRLMFVAGCVVDY